MTGYGQTIAIKPLETGPYGNGSSISVPIHIDDSAGNLKSGNVFKLYLSDAAENFTSEKEIGSFKGFYTTFINGIIPSDVPAGNYQVRVKTSDNIVISSPSNAFIIKTSSGVLADLDAASGQVISDNPKTFGYCRPERAGNFRFTNNSTPGARTSVSFVNELNPSDLKQFIFSEVPISFAADMTHYTITVKSELNGIIGTRAFFLINNQIKPGFNPPANNTVCLPAILEYDIETNSSNGIQNNFPGYSYKINWGDDDIQDVTPNQIIASGGKVKHTYKRSSCGKQIKINDVNYFNVFGIIYQVNSPFCGLISVPLSTQAKVITQPENRFTLSSAVCINTNIAIDNNSIAGDNPSSSSPECLNNEIVYYWYVDGKAVTPQGVPLSYKLDYKFTIPGIHTVRLESESNTNCQALPLEKTCYVQELPKPKFALTETLACSGVIIKATDQSIIDQESKAKNDYLWSVKGDAEVLYVNGTNAQSKNPEFQFNKEGIYTVQLAITSPCGAILAEQKVVINNKPSVITNWQNNLCGKNQLITFNNIVGSQVNTSFSGTAQAEDKTYTWQISGGNYSFKDNTHQNSKEPSILFEDYATYTIKITHQNNCGVETIIRTITFNESPTVSAGANQTVCAGTTITLSGSINGGLVSTYSWSGGKGVFSPSRDVLNAVYTPSPEETLNGKVELKLSVSTKNQAPCNLVEDDIIININPVNRITSAATKTICTNNAINYIPTASLEASTFIWTATGTANAKNFTTSGSGEIKDIIVNTDPVKEAVVKYVLIPVNNGCEGETFTLIVTVTATPKITSKPLNSTICSGKEAKIILESDLSGMRYTWTSTVTGNITGNSKQGKAISINAITDTLLNSGISTGSVTYTIIPENVTGCTGEPVKVTVNVSASPGITTFSPDKTTGCSPLAITFNNATPGSANTYYWDFGDGTTLVSKDNKPVNHVYTSGIAKNFTARLITETDCGKYTSEYIIRISPNTVQPELVVNGDQYEGCAPHTVKFFNNSKGARLFKYDFGDGTVIETNRSPETIEHTFTKGGIYKVKLTASNGCSDTTTTETITVYPQATTNFSADITEGCTSVKVKFTNTSSGALSYLWDFGDGTVSTEINPIHIFTNKKSVYTVRLIATSSFGCQDTLEHEDYIRVTTPPMVNFQVLPGETIQYPNYQFAFKDRTTGEVSSRVWDFGNGETSSLPNPEYHYADTGVYNVTLTVTGPSGCANRLTKTVRITGTPGSLFVANAFMPNSLTEELRIFKAKGSGIEKWRMRVFNKWGEMIWETDKLNDKGVPAEGWDGNMFGNAAPQGIYFWEISAKFKNGTEWPGMSFNNTEPKRTGTINLIR